MRLSHEILDIAGIDSRDEIPGTFQPLMCAFYLDIADDSYHATVLEADSAAHYPSTEAHRSSQTRVDIS